MLDFNYFKTQLPHEADIDETVMVEVVLTNGHAHRVRSVIEVRDGYVLLEVFQRGGDQATLRPTWKREEKEGEVSRDTSRAAVAYESIAAVVVGPAHDAQERPVGFFGR